MTISTRSKDKKDDGSDDESEDTQPKPGPPPSPGQGPEKGSASLKPPPGRTAGASTGASTAGGSSGTTAPVPAPAPGVKFALYPGQALDGILDYTTKAGRSYYHHATQQLDEDPYNVVPDEFYQFIQSARDRAVEYGWDRPQGILAIPRDASNPRSRRNDLLKSYGKITMEEVANYAKTFTGQPVRLAQDDAMLFQCLMNSMSREGKGKVTIWRADYTVNGDSSGICLLKVMIREGHLDTNATTSMIRTKLSNLDVYISTIGNDITKFNAYVKMLQDTLRARGEMTSDLLTNLFKGYGACSDRNFVDYIRRKQERYDEGEEVTANQLMNLADTKFKQLKDKEIWEAPSPEEEKILALEAKVKDLKQRVTGHKRQALKSEPKKDDQEKKKKGKDGKGGGKNKKEKPAWMAQRPPDEKLHEPRMWDGIKWYWCSPETGGKCKGHHRAHPPTERKGPGYRPKKKSKKVVINAALAEARKEADSDAGYESH